MTVPEKLHLLYPKSLAGRFELSNELRANVEVADTRSLIVEHRLIDIDEVRSLAKLVLRLEALCSTAPAMGSSNVTHDFLNPAKSPTSPISNTSALPSPGLEMTPSKRVVTRNLMRVAPPAYLGPHIREDMNDDELATIIESMTTRMENAMSSLVSVVSIHMIVNVANPRILQYVKQLGGLNSIMSAFEQLAKTEPMLLMKAMSYMGATQ
jgi:adenylate cyclase